MGYNDSGRQGSRFGSRGNSRSSGSSRNSGNDRGGRFGGSRGDFNNNNNNNNNRGGGHNRSFNDRPRELHKAVCADCGKNCEVPFKPTEDRPIFCRDCFAKQKAVKW